MAKLKTRQAVCLIAGILLLCLAISAGTLWYLDKSAGAVTSRPGERIEKPAAMVEDIYALLHQENLEGSVYLVDNRIDYLNSQYEDLFTYQEPDGSIDDTKKIIFVRAYDSCQWRKREGMDAAFVAKLFLYCRSRELPCEIVGLHHFYLSNPSEKDNSSYQPNRRIRASMVQMEEIYNKMNLEKLAYDSQVEQLSNWLAEHACQPVRN